MFILRTLPFGILIIPEFCLPPHLSCEYCLVLRVLLSSYVYLLYLMFICYNVSYMCLLYSICICCISCVFVVSHVYLLYFLCVFVVLCLLLFLL
jgi:hypothetical protein